MPIKDFKLSLSTVKFILLMAVANAILYHQPLLAFVRSNLDFSSFSGGLTFSALGVALLLVLTLPLLLLALISHRILKPFCMLLALGNSIAVYFVATYNVVLDQTLMGNVLNSNYAEAAELFHPNLGIYLLLLGVIPVLLLSRVKIQPTSRWQLGSLLVGVFVATVIFAYAVSGSWGWIDKHAKRLGGIVMPWSYLVNTARAGMPMLVGPREQVLLPAVTALNAAKGKTVVVLVIGESARAQNFQVYGYPRATNPQLAARNVIALQDCLACSTYTTASVRCILSHTNSGSEFSARYEPLPSYLQRSGVDVIWRTRNWGEPGINVRSYLRGKDLESNCAGSGCGYDEALLSGLERQIRESTSQKIFVVLHQTGSHGPAYSTKYPKDFEFFKPVCRSVELGSCEQSALINAYDNTIRYTDLVLAKVIDMLEGLNDTASLMLYISDHGESLGEYRLYLHGTPWRLAPAEQKQVPFIAWLSDSFSQQHGIDRAQLALQPKHSQQDVFHSVMGAFSLRSDVYASRHDIFSAEYGTAE